MNLRELETPCLILDKTKALKNIAWLHNHLAKLGCNLRPHGKSAKCIEVAKMSIEGQSGGIAVSTLKEAEYFFNNGITDIMYAVGIAPVKLPHIKKIVEQGCNLSIILDSIEQAQFVAEWAKDNNFELPVLIEIDCDGHRSGVTLKDNSLLKIGNLLNSAKGIKLAGIITHAGASYSSKTVDEIRECAKVERDTALACAERLRENNLPCPIVSIGSTPTTHFTKNLDGITEVRAGAFMFFDLFMTGLGVCNIEDIAVSVLTSVIGHRKEKNWVIADAGWMALSRDRGTGGQKVDQLYGVVCGVDGEIYKDILVDSTNQEHCIIAHRNTKALDLDKFKVGDFVRILPNHNCATGAMHDKYYVVDGSTEVIDVWERINRW